MTATPLIDRLVLDNFLLVASSLRDGRGTWLILVPQLDMVAEVHAMADERDEDVLVAGWKWLTEIEWMPATCSQEGFSDALAKLETKLSTVPEDLLRRGDSRWTFAVISACGSLEITRQNFPDGYSLERRLPSVPPDPRFAPDV